MTNPAFSDSAARIINQAKQGMIERRFCLGPIRLSVFAPTSGYPVFDHLVTTDESADPPDYTLVFVEARPDHPLAGQVEKYADDSFRAKRFRSGFYLTHHFGHPVLKVTLDSGATHLAMGRDVYRTFWTFYAKYIISHYSVARGFLHLKAAAVRTPSGGVVLLIGRGSGGKSVLMKEMTLRSFSAIANTHVLIKGGTVHGIQTSVRVRSGGIFDSLISQAPLRPTAEPGEYLCDPRLLFGSSCEERGALQGIVICHYGNAESGVRAASPGEMFTALTNFAYPLHTYGMKDDYLEFLHDDLGRFQAIYEMEVNALRSLAAEYPGFYCNMKGTSGDSLSRLCSSLEAFS